MNSVVKSGRGSGAGTVEQGRRALDFYETPPHYIAALFDEAPIFGTVFEPCVGEGAIGDAVRKLPSVRKVTTNDIDPKRKADSHFDARQRRGVGPFDWVITNPPFSDELEIVEQCMEYAPNLAFLARLSFLEPTEEREHFLESNPPQQIIVLPRYSFRPNNEGKKQTDSVTCAWLVWLEDRQPRRFKAYGRAHAAAVAVIRGFST